MTNTSIREPEIAPELWAILDSTGFPSCEVDYYRLAEYIATREKAARIDELDRMPVSSASQDSARRYYSKRMKRLKLEGEV